MLANRHVLLLAVLSLLWGANWSVMRIGLEGYPPFTMRGLIAVMGTVLMAAICVSRGESLKVPRSSWTPLLIASFTNLICWQAMISYAVILIPSGSAAVIGFLMPSFAALLSVVFLGERFSPRLIVALGLGMTGVAALVWRGFGDISAAPLGAGLMVVAAAIWAIGTVVQKGSKWNMPLTAVTAWQMGISIPPMLLLAALIDLPDMTAPGLAPTIAIVYIAVVPFVGGYLLWFGLVSQVPANLAALSTIAIPAVALITGWLALGEPLGWAQGVALACMTASLALTLFTPGRIRRARPVPGPE